MKFYYDRLLDSRDVTYRVVGSRLRDGVTGTSNNQEDLLESPEVIIKDVIREPLSIRVSHGFQYSNADLSTVRQNVEATFASLGAKSRDWLTSVLGNAVSSALNDDTLIHNADRFLQVIPPQDFFKIFTGTRVEIALQFRARLYNRYDDSHYLVSPLKQLQHVNKYFMGRYSGGSNDSIQSLGDGLNMDVLTYTPPHGYIGLPVDGWNPVGTLTLYYGSSLKIDNLLLTEYNFTFSREFDRNRCPLYIDVNFSLMPAILFTSRDVDNIISSYDSLSQDTDISSKEPKWNVGGLLS